MIETQYEFSSASDHDLKKINDRAVFLLQHQVSQYPLILMEQVHSNTIRWVDQDTVSPVLKTDGILSQSSNLLLGVFTADCLPILIEDQSTETVGAIHSGWKGCQQRILSQGLKQLSRLKNYNPKGVSFFIGPFIQSCCYEVGQEFLNYFPSETIEQKQGKLYLDLKKVILQELKEQSVPRRNIFFSVDCTACHPDYFSYRNNKTQERHLSWILKKAN